MGLKLPIVLVLGAIVVLALFFGLGGSGFRLSVGGERGTSYVSGWEIFSQPVGLQMKIGNYFTPIRNIQGETKYDFDTYNYGVPDIEWNSGGPRTKTTAWPYAEIERKYGDYLYVCERVDYEFEVTINTEATVELVDSNNHKFWHETSMPYEYQGFGTQGGNHVGKNFDGSLYVRFGCNPWMNYAPTQKANYTFTDYWFGVMDCYIEDTVWGQMEPGLAFTHAPDVRGLADENSHPPMFYDNASYVEAYDTVPWDATKVLDPDIASKVIIKLPFDMLAGAREQWHGGVIGYDSYIEAVYPVDVYATYTILVQGMVVREYTASVPQGGESPKLQPPRDWVPVKEPSWLDMNNYWLWIGLAVLVAIVILAIITPVGAMLLGMIFSKILFRRLEEVKMT